MRTATCILLGISRSSHVLREEIVGFSFYNCQFPLPQLSSDRIKLSCHSEDVPQILQCVVCRSEAFQNAYFSLVQM